MICRSMSTVRCSAQAPRRSALSSTSTPPSTLPSGSSGRCCGGRGSCGNPNGCCRKGSPHTPVPDLKAPPRQGIAPPPEALGIYYSTCSGKTEEVAGMIKEVLGDEAADPIDIGDVPDIAAALKDPGLDGIIVGAPTWNTGADEGRSGTAWDEVLLKVKGLDLSGRRVAVFGCGDQYSYGDYFCDAMEELHSCFAAAGADMVGRWPTDGYEHSDSKAEVEPGVFCGLAIDQDNQDDLTAERIKHWTAQVLQEITVNAAT